MRITCRQLDDLLDSHLDASLESRSRSELFAHLSLCSPCRRYVSGYAEALELARVHALAPNEHDTDREAWLDGLVPPVATGAA